MINGQSYNYHQDTPHKKIKLNEGSTLGQSPSTKTKKESILSKIRKRTKHSKREPRNFIAQTSQFQLPHQPKEETQQPLFEKMEDEKEEEQNLVSKISLNRKFTCVLQDEEEYDLSALNLYRNSSTCNQTRQIQDIKLGDNIYLKQVNSKTNNLTQGSLHLHLQPTSRIEQDYEIEQNLKLNSRYHSSYICLNKLERIFYYVKEVKMAWEETSYQESMQKLVSQQIKIYHLDPEGHFLRFYQSWMEHNSLYLTFEVALQSLDDVTRTRSRLREIQVWDLLRDCCSSLKWLSQSLNMCHLNIKPGNIIRCQRKFKLVDPYCTKNVLQMNIQKDQTNWSGWLYLAPEIKNYASLLEGLDFKQADIYSLGMSIIQNLLGQRYFPREGRGLRIYLQKHLHGYSPSLVRTLLGMVSLDPRKRPTAEQICMMQSLTPAKKAKVRRFSV